jgi:hypothetical protein
MLLMVVPIVNIQLVRANLPMIALVVVDTELV